MYGSRMDELLLITQAREAARSGAAAELRRACQLSQAEIARSVGVTPSAVAHWEAGIRLPRGAAAVRYGQLLEMLEARVLWTPAMLRARGRR